MNTNSMNFQKIWKAGLALSMLTGAAGINTMTAFAAPENEEVTVATYKVQLHSDGNGQITFENKDGDLFIEQGMHTFKVTANEGYELDAIYLGEYDISKDESFKLNEDGTFEWGIFYEADFKATFKKAETTTPEIPEEPSENEETMYRWNLSSDGNGLIRCEELGYDGGDMFVKDGTYLFEIIPNEGYELDKLYNQDDVDVTEYVKDSKVEWRVTYDGGLKATFKEIDQEEVNEFMFTIGSTRGGTLTTEDIDYDQGIMVIEGNYKFHIAADEGCEFVRIIDKTGEDVTEKANIDENGDFYWYVNESNTLYAVFRQIETTDPETPDTPTKPSDSNTSNTANNPEKETYLTSTGDTANVAILGATGTAALVGIGLAAAMKKKKELLD